MSEWEELEKLSKDELIIELVKARRDMRNICCVLDELSRTAATHFMYDKGEQPSESWLEKIVSYAAAASGSDELDSSDLEHYGVDADTAERFCYGCVMSSDVEDPHQFQSSGRSQRYLPS